MNTNLEGDYIFENTKIYFSEIISYNGLEEDLKTRETIETDKIYFSVGTKNIAIIIKDNDSEHEDDGVPHTYRAITMPKTTETLTLLRVMCNAVEHQLMKVIGNQMQEQIDKLKEVKGNGNQRMDTLTQEPTEDI